MITRLDIAFAALRLGQHNYNPGPEYFVATDRVLTYLINTRLWAIQFGGDDDFIVASDASFADNSADRKSS